MQNINDLFDTITAKLRDLAQRIDFLERLEFAGQPFNDARFHPFVVNDFFISAGTNPPFLQAAINAGTVSVPTSGFYNVNHHGIVLIRSGSTSDSGASILTSRTINLPSGGIVYEIIFRMSLLTNTVTRAGIHSTSTSADAADGVFFEISGGNLYGKTVDSANIENTATNYAPSTGTWYRARFVISADGTDVSFYLYNDSGSLLWSDSVADNTPTQAISGGVVVTKSTPGAVDLMLLDYMAIGWPRTALVR